MKTKRMLLISLFISLAATLSIVERSIMIPGTHPAVKLGLANVMTLLSIIMLSYKDAFLVVVLRCVIGAFVGGGPISFLFSITGGLFSTCVMMLLWRTLGQRISMVNISITGAVCHNLGQLFVASWLAHELLIYSVVPILMISAIVTGYVVGLVTQRVYKALQAQNVKVYG